mmetsp:Transcript_4706/g.9533  ORF Transcript_4706/g.9533 Transcript_4706/m.9533 type:complete len:374 (-) Transcript_4706:317-1438(-)
MLDFFLGGMHVDLRAEDKVLVVDIATKVRVNPTVLYRELFLRHRRVLGELLGQGVVDGQALHAFPNAVGPEGGSDDKTPKVGAGCVLPLANMVLDVAFRMLGNELVQRIAQPLDLTVGIFCEFHEHVVVVVRAEIAQLLRQRVRDYIVEPIQELITNDVREREWNHLNGELQVPQRLQPLHPDEFDHLHQNAPSTVHAIVHLLVHVLARLGRAVLRLEGNLALECMRSRQVLTCHPNDLRLFRNVKCVVHCCEDHDLALRAATIDARHISVEARDFVLIVGPHDIIVARPGTNAPALQIDGIRRQCVMRVQEGDGVAAVIQAQGVHDLHIAVCVHLQIERSLGPCWTLADLRAAAAKGDAGRDRRVQEYGAED